MVKELEALGLVRRTCELYIEKQRYLIGCDIIEKQINEALNTIQNCLEQINNANPTEALKCLERVDNYVDKDYDYCQRGDYDKDYVIIQQSLLKAQQQDRVLKIIKEKDVDIQRLMKCINVATYNNGLPKNRQLTQEEFDLLKRWVENE